MGKARRWIPPIPPPPGICAEGDTIKFTCPDGTIITAYICINGEWVRTEEDCCGLPPPEPCENGDTIELVCPDGTIIICYICIDGVWVRTEETCFIPPPYLCNLLQAVVYLNRCMAFWRGRR